MVDSQISEFEKIEEENKASSQFSIYCKKTHDSPLVHNKGAPKQSCIPIIQRKSKKFTAIYKMRKEPRISSKAISPNVIAEFNLIDSDTNINKTFKVPAFDNQPTLNVLTKKLEEETLLLADGVTVNLDVDATPSKSLSMIPLKHIGIESFAEDLSPTECSFLKGVYSCEETYFKHVLHIMDVSLQYAVIMEEVCKHANSNEIIAQIKELHRQAYMYPKMLEYKGSTFVYNRQQNLYIRFGCDAGEHKSYCNARRFLHIHLPRRRRRWK
eukprot:TRINITY_DN6414_c0_g1_i1.p1 TRINITY_DN6414_c0_g1~~TRINITY_DN6414_c0_g1_i1.p1  ORF type:complete len:269 (-),score=51.07 TRINITY_DN6414_c0_g1_i1:192-998(-)